MRGIMFLMAALVWTCAGQAAVAQDTETSGRGRGAGRNVEETTEVISQVRSFPLQHAECESVAEIIRGLQPGGAVVAARHTNSVVVHGTPRAVKIVEELIGTLDVASETGDRTALKVVPLQHRSARDVAQQVLSVTGQSDQFRVSADEARSCLLVLSRSAQRFAALEEVVRQIDTPARSVRIDFDFLSADLDASAGDGKLPDDLAALGPELARFGTLTLLARMSTAAIEGGYFKVRGGSSDRIQADVSGQIEQVDDGGAVRMAVSATAGLNRAIVQREKKEGEQSGIFSVETRVTAKPGETIVIGGAPTGLAPGQSVLLVVRVTK